MVNFVSNGIGMTIDMSTGQIKLPALQFTYDAKSTVPDQVTLTTANSTKGFDPNVYVFRTEQDLMNIWKKDSEYWLGGEFGHAKDILHIYNNFFTENQGIAIIQHLYPLYTLSMKAIDITPILNQYAQQAVDQLPSTYDEKIYRNFLDIWGTHIALETELGGMHEQLIRIKNCAWQSPYFTGGLNDSELELQLKQDLLSSTTLNNIYHKKRRKIILDHHIGGNVNVSDPDQWEKTLSSNPALLKISKYIPWFDVVQDSTIKTNLETAIRDHIDSATTARIAGTDQIKQQKLAARFSQLTAQAVVGHGPRGPIPPSWEIGNRIIMKDAQQCPEDLPINQSKQICNTGTYITSWNTIELTEPLRYEREVTTGNFRSIRIRDIVAGQIVQRFGPWVEFGCSLLPTSWSNINSPSPPNTIVAMLCSGCTPRRYGTNLELFSCECPSY